MHFLSKHSKEKKELSLQDKIAEAQKDRQEGNELFKKGQYRKAARCYNQVPSSIVFVVIELNVNQALSYFNSLYHLTADEEKQVGEAKLPLYLNLSVCNLKLDEISKAIKHAEKVFFETKNNFN